MLVLALDTASHYCATALVEGSKTLARVSEPLGKGHAERLMGQISEVMEQSGLPMQAIERIAVNIGPGSFTGVRVGVASARGLALALDKPIIGITVFEVLVALAHNNAAGQNRNVSVVEEAHRGALYVQHFDKQAAPISPPNVATAAEIAASLPENTVLIGSGAEQLANLCGDNAPALIAADPAHYVDIFARLGAIKPGDGTPPSPLYMRAPDAKPQAGFALPRVS